MPRFWLAELKLRSSHKRALHEDVEMMCVGIGTRYRL